MFTKEELINLLTLINQANILGREAKTVALLQQKIMKLLESIEPIEPIPPLIKTDNEH